MLLLAQSAHLKALLKRREEQGGGSPFCFLVYYSYLAQAAPTQIAAGTTEHDRPQGLYSS